MSTTTHTQHHAPGAFVEVKIDQTPVAKGQNVTAQRCVRIDGTHTLRLSISIDSSYPGQTRIVTELHDGTRWEQVWSYAHRDFKALPNAYSKQDQQMLPPMLVPVYQRMIDDALLILGVADDDH